MNDMITCKDPGSGLEIRLEFDRPSNSYRYLFSLDGKVTEDLFLPKDETRLGMNFLAVELLRKEVKRRS